ncbi:MAG TPA: hypothetical protein VMK12_25830 [Anaeromyxobacteraceae bacterium]|nr:hypothetical protein [Anaeromyxobacteraceae bacterium]
MLLQATGLTPNQTIAVAVIGSAAASALATGLTTLLTDWIRRRADDKSKRGERFRTRLAPLEQALADLGKMVSLRSTHRVGLEKLIADPAGKVERERHAVSEPAKLVELLQRVSVTARKFVAQSGQGPGGVNPEADATLDELSPLVEDARREVAKLAR